MTALERLLQTCPRDFFQQKLREIPLNPSDLCSPLLALQVLERCTSRDKQLGQKLDIPSLIPGLNVSSAVIYVSGLGKIKGTRALPETYDALEATVRREKDLKLTDIHRLFRHYNGLKACPGEDFSRLLFAGFNSCLSEADISQISAALKHISLTYSLLPASLSSHQVPLLSEALGRAWPALDFSVEQCTALISLAHSFAMLQMPDIPLWNRVLRDLVACNSAVRSKLDVRIVALALKKAKKLCEVLMPGTYSGLQGQWKEVDQVYRSDLAFQRRGNVESALARRVAEALTPLRAIVEKNGVIEEVFPYDLLISHTNLEIDGPAHYIRCTNGSLSHKPIWYYSVRDLALQAKGYKVTRLGYREVGQMKKEQITSKVAALI